MNMITAELIKYKRSFAKKLALIAPLFFVLYGAIIALNLPEQTKISWDLVLSIIFNWWPVIFVPIGIGLLCTLAENREKKAGNYRSLLANHIRLSNLWFSKIIAIGYYMLISSVVLIFATLATGLWTAGGNIPLVTIIGASLLIWLVSLSLIPMHLFTAARFGVLASLLLGFIGLLAGVLAADQPYWFFIPWSWAIRLMCPVIGVHPNGILLGADDPLLDHSVIPIGIIASLLWLALSSVLTSYWFSRREVRG